MASSALIPSKASLSQATSSQAAPSSSAAPNSAASVSHNTVGQRLGRKGQATRERILAAMLRLLDDADGPPVTLTSVAREAKVGLTNLYLYFPDLGDLLLAALGQVMATAEGAYLDQLRQHWPDDTLEESCLGFLRAHHAFWKRHARLLHMRNALADANDMRVLEYRQLTTRPLIGMLAAQMADGSGNVQDQSTAIATVLFTGLERLATVVTHPHYDLMAGHFEIDDTGPGVERLIEAEALVIALSIRQQRQLHGR